MKGLRLAVFAAILALALPAYAQSLAGAGGCARSTSSGATDGGQIPEATDPEPPQAPTPEALHLLASQAALDAIGGFLFSLAQDSLFCSGIFSSEFICPEGGSFTVSGSCELAKESCDWNLSNIVFLFQECGFQGNTLDGRMSLALSLSSCDPTQGVQAKLDSTGLGNGGDIRVLVEGDPVHLTSLAVDLSVAPSPVLVKVEKVSRIAGTFGDTCCLQDSSEQAIRCSRTDSDNNGRADLCELKVTPPDKPPLESEFPPCMTCDSDLDCPSTVSCSEGRCDFECNASSLCESDQDCTDGSFCIGGSCVFAVDCGGDGDCAGYFGPGSTCDRGACKPKSCSREGDCDFLGGTCGALGYCQWARCIRHSDYLGNEDVPDGCSINVGPLPLSCDLAGFCLPSICQSNRDCREPTVCTGGFCLLDEGGGGESCDPFPSCSDSEECQRALGPDYSCVSECCAFTEPPPCQEACGCEDASELNNVECVDGPQPDAACETYLASQLPPGSDSDAVAALAGCSNERAEGAGCCDLLRPAGGIACVSDTNCSTAFGAIFGGSWTCDASFSCVPVCGDGTCLPTLNENCQTCAADCGSCGPVCGDRNCDDRGGETCSSCPADCGACSGGR